MWSLRTRIRDPRHVRSKKAVALALTFAAGFVDIVGLLVVYKLFTAHVTGTTVRLGEQLIVGNWKAAAVAASVVGAFLLGSIAGRIIVEMGSRAALRRIASITLGLEAILLIWVIFWGSEALRNRSAIPEPVTYSLLTMLAGAMGVQTATLTKVGPLTIHTTFVTGMLNKLAELVSRWIFLNHEVRRFANSQKENGLKSKRAETFREAAFILAIWISYLLGALAGTWLGLRWQLKALYIPCLVLLLAIFVDQIQPLSLEEEREQSKT